VRFFAENWYLFVIALVSGTLLLWPKLRGGAPAGAVSANDAVMLINRERAVVIDVREATDYAGGHVPGSKNVPHQGLAQEQGPAPGGGVCQWRPCFTCSDDLAQAGF
jgi:hypothetical protein